MTIDGKLLARARERLALRRAENETLRTQREKEVYARVPAVKETDARLRALVGQVLRLTAAPEETGGQTLRDIEQQSMSLCAEKAEALTSHGFPADYLDEISACPRCHDTGYLPDGKMCVCLKALYEEERTAELSSVLKLGEESFADFRLDYYPPEARECMELTLNYSREYAVTFGRDSANLLFQGGTGLGKTFLSGCIARVVSARGFSVVYETAQGAFAAFEAQKFSRDAADYGEASEKVRRILSCELLILDDLGTELTTSFTQSALYNIINTRLTDGKKTIISTNLKDSELAGRYLPQIISRLNGEFDTLLFQGRDIRAIKKEQRY